MEPTTQIIINENITLEQHGKIYRIQYKYPEYSLINSLIKTRLIQGGYTDDSYRTILFKADSVKTLKEFQHEKRMSQGKRNLQIPDVANMIRTLSMQLNYLIQKESRTILGYAPEEIIVINGKTFAFLGSDLVANIDPEGRELAMISCPFSVNNFFAAPELLDIKVLPSFVHYKVAYFSLGLLVIYCLLADDEYYHDYLKHKHSKNIINNLNNHSIKNTKLYWLLSRCLDEDPKNRSIILI